MRSPRDPVKGRTEAGRRREQRARATRDRIVRAATDLFLERGYAATTVEAIAGAAGVGVATVYQAFGTKAAIVARALDVAIAGDDEPQPLLARGWVRAARAEPDPHRRLSAVIEGGFDVAFRSAPMKEVLRDAAATEPLLRELLERDEAQRLITHRELVTIVLGETPSDAELAAFYLLANSASYQLAAARFGWDPATWRGWLHDLLAGHLRLDER